MHPLHVCTTRVASERYEKSETMYQMSGMSTGRVLRVLLTRKNAERERENERERERGERHKNPKLEARLIHSVCHVLAMLDQASQRHQLFVLMAASLQLVLRTELLVRPRCVHLVTNGVEHAAISKSALLDVVREVSGGSADLRTLSRLCFQQPLVNTQIAGSSLFHVNVVPGVLALCGIGSIAPASWELVAARLCSAVRPVAPIAPAAFSPGEVVDLERDEDPATHTPTGLQLLPADRGERDGLPALKRACRPSSADIYKLMDTEALVAAVSNRDELVRHLRTENKALKRQLVRQQQTHQCRILALAATHASATSSQQFALAWKGKGGERPQLTPRGQIAAALRRNLGNVVARDFGSVVLADASGNTIIRAEIVMGATRAASFRSFHCQLEAEALVPPSTPGVEWHVSVHAFSSDATTSNVWQHSKLHSTEIESLYALHHRGEVLYTRKNRLPICKGSLTRLPVVPSLCSTSSWHL